MHSFSVTKTFGKFEDAWKFATEQVAELHKDGMKTGVSVQYVPPRKRYDDRAGRYTDETFAEYWSASVRASTSNNDTDEYYW